MTVRAYKKKNLFLIISLSIIAIGIAAFVISFGLSKGWDVVAAWFSSDDAIFLYILLGCYGLLVAYLFIYDKVKRL